MDKAACDKVRLSRQNSCSTWSGSDSSTPTKCIPCQEEDDAEAFEDTDVSRCPSELSDTMSLDPSQTLIFLDWDDTLFPTTYLFKHLELHKVSANNMPNDIAEAMDRWRDAVYEFLCVACSLSDCCVIVTNSSHQWVDYCIDRFAPNLRPLFDRRLRSALEVVYARPIYVEHLAKLGPKRLQAATTCFGSIVSVFRAWWKSVIKNEVEELEEAKRVAMKQKVDDFYSRYAGQTWKNILSLGDMWYEYYACQQLGRDHRAAYPSEGLWTKAILVPTQPTLSELTLRLNIIREMLRAFVQHNGSVDLDLSNTGHPMKLVADTLGIPELTQAPVPLHTWGLGPAPDDCTMMNAIDRVALAMRDHFLNAEGRDQKSFGDATGKAD